MTTQDKPAVGPLSAGDVPLLVKGDLLRYDGHFVEFANADTGEPLVLFTNGPAIRVSPSACAFIGRPGPDGWIKWSGGPNPVPGRMASVRTEYGDEFTALAGFFFWDAGTDIIAFRLAPTAPVETLGHKFVADLSMRGEGDCMICRRSQEDHTATQPDTGKVEAGGVEHITDELKPNDIAAILEENADVGASGLHNASQLAQKIYYRMKELRPQPSGETREAPNLVERLRGWPHHVEGADYSVASIQALMNEAANALITPADQAKGGEG